MPLDLNTPFPGPWKPNLPAEIQRRTPAAAGGMELTHLPHAQALTPLPPPARYILPFHPVRLVHSNGNWSAYLQPGHIKERHVEMRSQNNGGLNIVPAFIGSNSIWEEPPVPLSLAGNVSFNYLQTNTNYLGLRTSNNWQVVSSPTELNSTHHIPPDPGGGGGVNGVYNIEIFRTNFDSSSVEEQVELKWGGDVEWDQALWQGEHPESPNGGAGQGRPYIDFEEDLNQHRFRVHLESHGHNIVEGTQNITHAFCGTNVGNATGNTIGIYTGNTEKNCAEFVYLAERQTGGTPQISLLQADNESPGIIQGNGKAGTINFMDCNGNVAASVSWDDGLWTSAGTINIVIPNCTNSNTILLP